MVLASPREWSAGRCWPGMAMALLASVERLANDVPGDERDIGRTFGKTTHEVRIPLGAERHVAAHAIPLLHERLLEITPDAVQHLELEAVDADALLLRPALRFSDHRGIVRGDAGIVALEHQLAHALDVVGVDVLLVR